MLFALARFQAAIFDMDETIVDLQALHAQADAWLCHMQGCQYEDLPAHLRDASGMRVLDKLAAMARILGWSSPARVLMQQREVEFLRLLRQAKPEPLPGVRAIIQDFHARGLRLAIASSGTRTYLESALAGMCLRPYFEVIVSGDDSCRPKPAPDPYLTAAARLGLAPDTCVALEDSAIGVAAARAAGCFVVAIPNPRAAASQDLAAADRILPSMACFPLHLLDRDEAGRKGI